MPFDKGKSGNPKGRPIGSTNRATRQIAERVQTLIDDNMEQLEKDLKALSPADRVKSIISLMQYVLPKQQNINMANQIEMEYKELGILLNDASEESIKAIAAKMIELKTLEDRQ